MIHITPGAVVNALLKQGIMVKAGPDTLFKSNTSHCVVLLNKNPHTDPYLVFVSATSQYEKRIAYAQKLGLPPTSIVMVRPNTYFHLPKYTAFDCNYVYMITKSVFIALYGEEQISFYKTHPTINEEHLKQLMTGVHASPLVLEEVKSTLGL